MPKVNYTCSDHIELNDSGQYWMKSSYFEQTLNGLDGFDGFFPRLYLPSSNMVASKDKEGLNSHQSLAMIDTAKEIEVGVGYDWPPVVLESGEIQIPAQLATYLNITVNDTVELTFGVNSINENK